MKYKSTPIELLDHPVCLRDCHRIISTSSAYLKHTGKQHIHLYKDDYLKIKKLLDGSGFDADAGFTILGATVICTYI